MKALTTLFVIGMFATAVAIADDVDDVIAAVRRYTTALNTEDANALMQLHALESTSFDPRGGLLETFDSLEQAVLNNDTGLKYNLQARDIGVRVYGNLTAVATSYAVGTITRPNGTTGQVNIRITMVWVKQGGQWKVVHRHHSPLRLPQ